ncbi:serum paraoxonase/arylesterase [Coprinopsis sp. MPI-PUGE-AT-0042]|nr:serum paraoxonase/arylesterase [Coprinopsis sp. MPI-PUGE-AT-0042]
MGRLLINVLVVLAAVVGGLYQFKVKPRLERLGYGRVIQSIGNDRCTGIPELKACEKLVIHQPSGLLYLACSTPESRVHWTPTIDHLNAAGASRDDYVAVFNPQSQKISRLKVTGFTSERGLSLHGMDVVPDAEDPNQLWVFLVNHRAPLAGDATKVGADSVVEVFKTYLESPTLEYVRTVEDERVITPNDLIGSADGKSFYVTNDHGAKVGLSRHLETLGYSATSVVYCDVDEGCKYAIQGMYGINGIAQAPNGTVYVVDSMHGAVNVMEKQVDHTLVLTDYIEADRSLDNAMVDSEGHLWVAGFPNVLDLVYNHFKNPLTHKAPSSALRFSINTGKDAFYGHKFKVDAVFEDDGAIASGSTTAAYDAERQVLYLTGLASPQLTICKM